MSLQRTHPKQPGIFIHALGEDTFRACANASMFSSYSNETPRELDVRYLSAPVQERESMASVHSGACGAPNFPGLHEKSLPRTALRGGAGHKIDRAGRGGASFWAPRSHPRSGAPPFNRAPPGAPRFFNGVDRAFYGCDRIFYGRDGVFRTIYELLAYFKLLRYAGAA